VAAVVFTAPAASQGSTTRVSLDSAGVEGNGASAAGSITADGRYIAFQSLANNLVPGDTNGCWDIFRLDRHSGQVILVSVDSSGVQADSCSTFPVISDDGRYVAFESAATNLVPGDTNGRHDVFVHDCQTGQTIRASVDSSGAQANDWSAWATISGDGSIVGFFSIATNLVPGDTNGLYDVFVHDLQTGQTAQANVSSMGAQANGESVSHSMTKGPRRNNSRVSGGLDRVVPRGQSLVLLDC